MGARGVRKAAALFVAATLCSAPMLPAQDHAAVLEGYRGVWRYADGDRGREQIEVAIRRAVDGLPFFAEPFAARQIREISAPFERVRFIVEGDRLAFRADGWGPVGSRVGGPTEVIRDPEGYPLRMRQYVRNGRLVQVFTTDDGTRENSFALSGDGQWLWMSVRITSPRLPADVRYRLRYRREGAPPTQHAAR